MKSIYRFYLDSIDEFFNWYECDMHKDIIKALLPAAVDMDTYIEYFGGNDVSTRDTIVNAIKSNSKIASLLNFYYMDSMENESFRKNDTNCYYSRAIDGTIYTMLHAYTDNIDYSNLGSSTIDSLASELSFCSDSIAYTIN